MTGLAVRYNDGPMFHTYVGDDGYPLRKKTAVQTRAEVDRAGRAVGETVGGLPRGSDPIFRRMGGVAPPGPATSVTNEEVT
jgi:hypothetical protein